MDNDTKEVNCSTGKCSRDDQQCSGFRCSPCVFIWSIYGIILLAYLLFR